MSDEIKDAQDAQSDYKFMKNLTTVVNSLSESDRKIEHNKNSIVA